MSGNKKTIKINLDDFAVSSKKKSRKNTNLIASKERNKRASPIFKPNALKKKLIERIKQHKGGSIHSNNSDRNSSTGSKNLNQDLNKIENVSKDEFRESLKYLSELTKQKDKESPYPSNIKTKHKTAKIYELPPSDYVPVSIDLPEDLKSYNPEKQNTIKKEIYKNSIINNNPHKNTPPPYGCLKGGEKPTYRTWNKTIKNSQEEYSINKQPLLIQENNQDLFNAPVRQLKTEREEKLDKLKQKFKEINRDKMHIQSQKELINHPTSLPLEQIESPINQQPIITESIDNKIKNEENLLNLESNDNIPIITRPKRTKKTTTRKYKLGKQIANRKIGVLIKDRNTRKQILDAQKAIRRKSLVEIKNYLHAHGLIKYGSKAPNDVLRKIYESSLLAGEINNQDSDVLAYNMLNNEENF